MENSIGKWECWESNLQQFLELFFKVSTPKNSVEVYTKEL